LVKSTKLKRILWLLRYRKARRFSFFKRATLLENILSTPLPEIYLNLWDNGVQEREASKSAQEKSMIFQSTVMHKLYRTQTNYWHHFLRQFLQERNTQRKCFLECASFRWIPSRSFCQITSNRWRSIELQGKRTQLENRERVRKHQQLTQQKNRTFENFVS
jgi:hypothetical protein